jgi:hypothetical protein
MRPGINVSQPFIAYNPDGGQAGTLPSNVPTCERVILPTTRYTAHKNSSGSRWRNRSSPVSQSTRVGVQMSKAIVSSSAWDECSTPGGIVNIWFALRVTSPFGIENRQAPFRTIITSSLVWHFSCIQLGNLVRIHRIPIIRSHNYLPASCKSKVARVEGGDRLNVQLLGLNL